MAAYAISEVEILDPDQAGVQELAAASIARYGGRYLVRDARPQVPEGDPPSRSAWSSSSFPAWNAARVVRLARVRRGTADQADGLARRLLFVAGVDDARDEAQPGTRAQRDEGEPGDLGGARGRVKRMLSRSPRSPRPPRPPRPMEPRMPLPAVRAVSALLRAAAGVFGASAAATASAGSRWVPVGRAGPRVLVRVVSKGTLRSCSLRPARSLRPTSGSA